MNCNKCGSPIVEFYTLGFSYCMKCKCVLRSLLIHWHKYNIFPGTKTIEE